MRSAATLGVLLLVLPSPVGATCAERLLPPRLPEPSALRAVQARDLIELRDFGDPAQGPANDAPFALSPDRALLALAIRRADIASNGYCNGILVVPSAGGSARLVDVGGAPLIMVTDYLSMADKPNGVVAGSALAWSPDGIWIYFLRRDYGITQLWRTRADGGGSEPLTDFRTDVRAFSLEPNGDVRLSLRPGVAAVRAAIEAEGQGGYLYDRRFWPVANDKPMPTADIAFEHRILDPETRTLRDAERPLTADPPGSIEVARGTRALAWTHRRDPKVFLSPTQLSVRYRGREVRCMHISCADRVVGIWWEPSGTLLYLRDWGAEARGRVALYRWRPGGKAPRQLWETDDLLIGCRYAGAALLCAQETATQPRRLVRVAVDSGAASPVFDPNLEWVAVRTGAVTVLAVAASDGTPTYARLLLPPQHGLGDRHPLVVVQYTSRGFLRGGTGDEYPMHLLAERGFAVLSFQKPRQPGADGDPRDLDEYVRRNVAGLAERRRIHSALEAAVDAAVATGAVDSDRIGITGLSDGVSTIAYALLNSDRYRVAALSTCCDEPSFTHSVSGVAYAEATEKWGYPGYGELGFWKDYSLARNAARVCAPLLIQAADEEFRMALDTVAALRAAKRPVEMHVFPGEHHIKWQPGHRSAIYLRVVDWFEFWLTGRRESGPPGAQQARWQTLFEQQEATGCAFAGPARPPTP